MRIMEIGAQSYTVRAYCQNAEDLGQTLEKIAAIGYRSVQLSAIGPIAPEQVKALCDRNGLRIVLTHNPESDFLDHPEELENPPETVRFDEGMEYHVPKIGSQANS